MQHFKGKKAVVIGGSGGIGSALCRNLAKQGASLVVHGGHKRPTLENQILDLQKSVEAKALIQLLETGFAKKFSHTPLNLEAQNADIVCINYGPFMQKKLHEMDTFDWETVIELNLLLPGILISTALPNMIKNGYGRFLLFGGTRTDRVNAFSTNAAYGAVKTAVSSLVRSTALEYAKNGITCNAIFPGFTRTEYMSKNVCDELVQKMPQKRLIEVNEIANTAIQLLEQPMVNGALVTVDGGWDPSFW